MIRLSVEIKGVRQTVGKLNRLNVVAKQRVREQVAKSALAIERKAKREAPVDTGRLRSSIQSQFYSGGLSAEVGPSVHYGPYVEFGTGLLSESRGMGRSGSSSPYFPPPSALKGWCRRVLKDENLAFVVARSIFKKGGTKPRPFLFPAYEEERPRFERGIALALKQAVRKSGMGGA